MKSICLSYFAAMLLGISGRPPERPAWRPHGGAGGRRAAASASARTRFSGVDDGDGLDLDHEIGSGETGDADGRAGRGRHPEIAHADVGTLLELVEVGDKGVGLDDVGPGSAGRLQTPVEV